MAAQVFNEIYGNYDKPQGLTPTEQTTIPQIATPYQRVVKTFLPNEFGEFSNEVSSIIEVSCMSMFFGAMYGGVMSSKTAYLEFFQNNQATAFKDHLEAKKRLQDKVTLAFGRGAFKLAWRLTLFSTSYVTFTTAVAVYRGKNGILEHVVGGGLAGSTYKFNGGPRAMLVGGVLGGALGFVAGAVTLGLLKVTGMEMSDVRGNSKRWNELRMGKMQVGLREYYAEKESPEEIERAQKMKGVPSDLEVISTETTDAIAAAQTNKE